MESCACLAQEQAPTVSFRRVIMISITFVVHSRMKSKTIRTGKAYCVSNLVQGLVRRGAVCATGEETTA